MGMKRKAFKSLVGKPVWVRWRDASSDSRWQLRKDAEALSVWYIETWGMVIAARSDDVLISSSIGGPGNQDHVSDTTSIPYVYIEEVQEIV